MKINKILIRFLQVLVVTGSAIFTSKSATAENKKSDEVKTINDRINSVREHIRNNDDNSAGVNNRIHLGTLPIDQIWINIVPGWNDWNKLWNDWSNWNNWGNFHRDHDFDHHDRGHDRGHDHDHDKDHGHGR